ncbi:hypothetical protein C0J52_27134 [Blattella germanica]|nr:hypothetical protein C0J52_27134 [Blattella germanica]
MDNNRGMPEGTRTRGRPRQRWIDNVMTDVREFGILNIGRKRPVTGTNGREF